MNNITSLKERLVSDLMPPQAGKLHQLFKITETMVEKWGYLPVIPSLYKHRPLQEQGREWVESGLSFRSSLSAEILNVIENHLSVAALPKRLWYGGPVCLADKEGVIKRAEAYEMGIEHIGSDSFASDAEVISIAIGILKELQIREFKVTLGNSLFLHGLEEAKVKGATRKAALVKGQLEEVVQQAQGFSDYKMCGNALEDLKVLGRYIREFGYKEPVQYDLSPFLSSNEYGSLMFKIESGDPFRTIISGGRRKSGPCETTGFSFDVEQMLEVANQMGMPLPALDIDFLLVNRKKSRKSTFEIMKVLREHGYSVVLDHSDLNREELLDYANKARILNLVIVGDEDAALNEVRLIDVIDKISTKIIISELFDKKSGLNKLLRYHKRLELGQ